MRGGDDVDSAQATQGHCLEVEPTYSDAHILMAQVIITSTLSWGGGDDVDSAQATLGHCLEVEPTYSDAHILMAQVIITSTLSWGGGWCRFSSGYTRSLFRGGTYLFWCSHSYGSGIYYCIYHKVCLVVGELLGS